VRERERGGDSREDWLLASTEITRQLLSVEGEEPLTLIATRLQDVAAADAVNVVVPTPDGLRVRVAVATGSGADRLLSDTYPLEGTVSQVVLETGHAVLIGDMAAEHEHTVHLGDVVPVGPLMVLPLVGTRGVLGTLVVGRLGGRPRFTQEEMDMATTFAGHAAVALELADARADRERLALLEDHERIARDLHDHVIQRLFGAGLTVQSVAAALGGDAKAARLGQVVDDIDETVRQIRHSIFRLRGALGPSGGAVRPRLVAVATEVEPLLGFAPVLTFAGPVDSLVPDGVLDDLVAVVREGLTNVARHARARSATIAVTARGDGLTVTLADDGVGLRGSHRRSGLANLRRRAEGLGGSLTITDEEGTCLTWSIPLS